LQQKMKAVLVVLLICVLCRGDYSLNSSTNYLMHAYASYCDPSQISSWDCFWCTNTTEPLNVTQMIYNSYYNILGFAGYNSKEIMVVFRGTREDSAENLLIDLKSMFFWPWTEQDHVKVGYGFLSAYESVMDDVRSAVTALTQQFPNLPVTLVGHSMGGALTTLTAVDIAEQLGIGNITHWTYGSPVLETNILLTITTA